MLQRGLQLRELLCQSRMLLGTLVCGAEAAPAKVLLYRALGSTWRWAPIFADVPLCEEGGLERCCISS